MRRGNLLVDLTLAALAAGWTWACSVPPSRAGDRPLATVAELRALSPDELARGRRVSLRGVVTHFSPTWRQLVIHDGTGGVMVDAEGLDDLLVARGSAVDVDGFTSFDERLPVVVLPTVRPAAERALPQPSSAPVARISAGLEDGQWLEVVGSVRVGALLEEGRVGFEIDTGDQTLKAVAGSALDDVALARAGRVRIRGVPISSRPGEEGGEVVFQVGGGDDITTLDGKRLAGTPAAPAPRPARAEGPVALSTVRQVKSLRPAQAAEQRPLRLRGVVTLSLPIASGVLLQDETGAIFVHHGEFGREGPAPGTRVEVEGVSEPGEYAPIVAGARLRLLGPGGLPPPVSVVGLRSLPPERENAYTEVRGVVQDVRRTSADLVRILIATHEGVAAVQMEGAAGADAELSRLLDAEVLCRGVVNAVHSGRQLVGVQVLTRLRELSILRRAPDAAAAPSRPLADLRAFGWEVGDLHRVQTLATVTAVFHGGRLYVADGVHAAAVRAEADLRPAVGSRVRVSGFLAPGRRLLLQHSVVREDGRGELSPPVPVQTGEALGGSRDAMLVRMEGRLLGTTVRPGRTSLTMSAGGQSFLAELETPRPPEALTGLRAGSLLALVGICEVDWDTSWEPATARAFRLRLRAADDVTVLRPASWWTSQRVAALLVLVSSLALGTVVWSVLLRRQVRAQTAVICEQMQAERRSEELLRSEAQERERLIGELSAKNAELERFVYTVSHDLRSPIVTIKGFLGFLVQDAEGGNIERLRGDVRRISSATDRLRALLDGLLELSRVGRVVNASDDVDLGAAAAQAIEQLEGLIASTRARVHLLPGLPVVRGDRLRLVEVYQNLIENALKFSASVSEPLVEVGVREVGGERVLFVRDNGEGVEPVHHEKVFGLFERLGSGDHRGLGIGLALVRRIVEYHGGRAWVESEGGGRGATLCFTLPGVPGEPEAARTVEPAVPVDND